MRSWVGKICLSDMIRLFYFMLWIWIVPIDLTGQKSVNLCGNYIYYPPETLSLVEAKRIAAERARLEALADEYGTLIFQNTLTYMKNMEMQSSTDFLSLTMSEVKGEWLGDIKDPDYRLYVEKDVLVIEAKVCGKAREIRRSPVNFDAKALRNGDNIRFESADFREGDNLYLYFKSPSDGYLAVYLIDEAEKAYRLLPALFSKEDSRRVESGKEYVFFKTSEGTSKNNAAIKYRLTCSKSVEYNLLYVVYSKNPFVRVNDTYEPSCGQPSNLSNKKFQKWLLENRQRDLNMQVEVKLLKIEKTE